MRLLRQAIDLKKGSGFARLLPEEPEDMWHAYNLIQPSDLLTAKAYRRITTEYGSGSSMSQRVATDLTIRVTSTDFDVSSGQLHVSGKVARENEYVKLGGYHTLDLELQRYFQLEKGEGWDSVALELLKEACDTEKRAELWAVVMGEGTANVCLITEYQTILRQRIEVPVPRKRKGGLDGHEKGMEKFFSTTLESLLRYLDLSNTSSTPGPTSSNNNTSSSSSTSSGPSKTIPLLLASPGFTASSFLSYIKSHATRTNNKALLSLIPSIIVTHSSSHHLHSLTEILSSPAISTLLSDTKYFRETALMDKLTTLLRHDDGRAWYGPREVARAVDRDAVGRGGGVLLISNKLFRAQNVAERKRWVQLVDRVREGGGEVRVLSELHESGKRLEALGNVAAILTFPCADLDESEDEDDAGDIGGDEGLAEGVRGMVV